MKIGFSLIVEEDRAEDLLRAVKEAGFQGMEPTFHPEGVPSPERAEKEAEMLGKMARGLGLEVPSMRGGPLFWDAFPFQVERTLDLTRKALEAVKAMGGDTLLVVPGRWKEGISYVELYEKGVEVAKEMGKIAEEIGVRIGFENVENKFLLSPKEWSEFLDEVGSPYVGMYFDVGNVIYTGLGHPQDWLRDLGGRICRLHFKDAREKEVLQLGEGEVDWKAVMEAIRAVGYDGWACVELPLPEKDTGGFLKSTYRKASEIVGTKIG